MIVLLYNLCLLGLLVVGAPVWLVALWRVPKMRAGFWHKLGVYPHAFWEQVAQTDPEKRIWVHAVSVGELNAARRLIQTLKDDGWCPLVSTTTLTGYRLAQSQWPMVPVFYFPFDLSWVVSQVTGRIAPKALVILETELWPNLLFEFKRQQIPVVLVNARLSEKSFRGYRRVRFLMGSVLGCFTQILAQTPQDASRLEALGAQSVTVMGNLKYEAPEGTLEESVTWLKGAAERPVLVVASTHPDEETLLCPLLQAALEQIPQLQIILAPRHPERAGEVENLLVDRGFSVLRRSLWTCDKPIEAPIILLDTIGELQSVFAQATLCLMGGTFVPWGGHNVLEPLHAGCPVVFGPSMTNFQQVAYHILKANAGVQVQTVDEALVMVLRMFQDTPFRDHSIENGSAFLAQYKGLTKRVYAQIQPLLPGTLL